LIKTSLIVKINYESTPRQKLCYSPNEQISQQIRLMIENEEWLPGILLPTVKELAKSLKLNYNTVAAIYRGLEREGYVVQNRRAGTKVAEHPPRKPEQHLEHHLASEFAKRLQALQLNPEETLKLTLAQAAVGGSGKPLRVAVVAQRPLEASQLSERYQAVLGTSYVCVGLTPESYVSSEYALTLIDPSLITILQTLLAPSRYESVYSTSFPAGAD
jgi:DNA-binding transcriptional regulator YhcF (GntR family)